MTEQELIDKWEYNIGDWLSRGCFEYKVLSTPFIFEDFKYMREKKACIVAYILYTMECGIVPIDDRVHERGELTVYRLYRGALGE